MLIYKCEAVCVSSAKKALCTELKYAMTSRDPSPKYYYFQQKALKLKRLWTHCGTPLSRVGKLPVASSSNTELVLGRQPPRKLHMTVLPARENRQSTWTEKYTVNVPVETQRLLLCFSTSF